MGIYQPEELPQPFFPAAAETALLCEMILSYKGKILPQPGSFYPGRLHHKSSLFQEKVL